MDRRKMIFFAVIMIRSQVPEADRRLEVQGLRGRPAVVEARAGGQGAYQDSKPILPLELMLKTGYLIISLKKILYNKVALSI